ncbi:MAG: hypothetical protein LBD58_12705 [Treponema sp.]|nr:hypothetical protein [Treponema sp.]
MIELYCTVCHYYDNLAAKARRMSGNDMPLFTGCECVAIYLLGMAERMFTVKSAYEFVRDFFRGGIPIYPVAKPLIAVYAGIAM